MFPIATAENPLWLNDERLALLVAGINYPRKVQGNADPHQFRTYYNYCLNYKTYLLDNGTVDRVIIFDFLKGETRSFEKTGSKDGQVNVQYGELKPKNFRFVDGDTLRVKRVEGVKRWYFTSIDDLAREQSGDPDADVSYDSYKKWNGGAEKSMSVSDLYGMFSVATHPTYHELHFFGHAIHDGPIIVNTDYYQSKFYDKDARIRDFTNPKLDHVFGPSHIARAKASFVTEPLVCVWGCDADKEAVDLLKKAQEKDARGENIDAEVTNIRAHLDNTYAHHLAKTMGFKVLSALPGTGAVHEGEPNDDPSGVSFKPTAMHVNLTTYEQVMKLYAKYLGVKFATTGAFKGHPTYGRGYAIFEP